MDVYLLGIYCVFFSVVHLCSLTLTLVPVAASLNKCETCLDKCEMMSEVLHLEYFYMGTEGASWNSQCMKGQGDGIKCVPKALLLIQKVSFRREIVI